MHSAFLPIASSLPERSGLIRVLSGEMFRLFRGILTAVLMLMEFEVRCPSDPGAGFPGLPFAALCVTLALHRSMAVP